MKQNRIIGLTGGIGAGKSVVSRILRLKGYPVYDCDSEAKRIMAESSQIMNRLCDKFGNGCLNTDGTLNRKYLSERVFGNSGDLAWLNLLVHSEVRKDFCRWAEGKKGLCFVESAILNTSHLDDLCSEIWLVDAPEDIRFERAMHRGGVNRENLRKRMEVQKKEFEGIDDGKVRIIYNFGEYSLLDQISCLLR